MEMLKERRKSKSPASVSWISIQQLVFNSKKKQQVSSALTHSRPLSNSETFKSMHASTHPRAQTLIIWIEILSALGRV